MSDHTFSSTPPSTGARMSGLTDKAARQPLLHASDLCLTRDNRQILSNVSLTIHPGEITTIIGPNGGGKSTLLRVLLGLVRPDAGVIQRREPLSIGYVPQKLSLGPTMPLTVMRLMALTRKAGKDAILAALRQTRADHLLHASVLGLSGGELQRVLLARAILHGPDLLVLDEPVQGVDFQGEIALYDLIASVRDVLGCAVLMVSHDLHVVMRQTDHVLCLNGHICCSGTPAAVTQHAEYARLFGPRAAETVALYTHHHDHHHHLDGAIVSDEDCSCGHAHEDGGQDETALTGKEGTR